MFKSLENITFKSAIFLGILVLCGALNFPAIAQDTENDLKQKVAKFLNLPEKQVFIDCKNRAIDFPILDGQKSMRFCMQRTDPHHRRCEISIESLKTSPEPQKISFEVLVENNAANPKSWFSIMQIHAFPDKGESWRCPPFSMEYHKDSLRLFNRWDTRKVSQTTGNNCIEEGSSIESRSIFTDKEAPSWTKISLDMRLSFEDDGYIKASVNKTTYPTVTGPNIFNDKRNPFLKLGMYKPTSWDKQHKMTCITYRNVDISALSK